MSEVDQERKKSPFKGKTGLARVWNATFHSLAGLKSAYRHESAFRQEAWLAAALIPLAFVLPATGAGRALMVASVLLALIVEMLNSAVEAVVDRVSLERHELSKRAKDLGSAAVMLALINVVVTWALVLFG